MSNGKKPDEKAVLTLLGRVEKLIRPIHPNEPEKVQIAIEGADELCQEIRAKNSLRNPDGQG